MRWPLSQDYNEAIQSPRENFSDYELKWCEAVTNPLGIPLPRSGNFADVYQLRSPQGGSWAVKCFTRQVTGLRERYAAISRHLAQSQLPFMVDFTFLDQGIRVCGRWFPTLKMQWVDGLTLNEFVRQYADKPPMLDKLLQIWVRMAARLRQAGIAHADLQHGNVLLVPGLAANALALKLVDYDGMFVPALAGSDSGEVGHPCYQHPKRLTERTYSLEVDRFPLLLIATALSCLKVGGRKLWDKYDNGDNLLFCEADLQSPVKSLLFYELLKLTDPQASRLVRVLLDALKGRLESVPLLEELLPELPSPSASKPAGATPPPNSRTETGPAATPPTVELQPAAQPSWWKDKRTLETLRSVNQPQPTLPDIRKGGKHHLDTSQPEAETQPNVELVAANPADRLDFRNEGEPRSRRSRMRFKSLLNSVVACAVLAGPILIAGLAVRSLEPPPPNHQQEEDEPRLSEDNSKPKSDKDKVPAQAFGKEWIDKVAALPAGKRVKEVEDKLKELNPGFDGVKNQAIEGGVVTSLEFVTDRVTNLSPLLALTGLKQLSCVGSGDQKGKLVDLSPLKDMHLTSLNCQFNNGISDLSPLKDMKLKWLCCIGTSVSDLSPLKRMPLNSLACWGTAISDLSPLKDMPLETLLCGISKVSDLSPLKGMPLKTLGCGSTQVSDLSPLKEMRLECLVCFETTIKDLSALKGMPLAELHCQNTRVTDLSLLKDMPLKILDCDFQSERDAAILRSIKTLEKIKGKPVAQFWKEVDEQKRKEIAPSAAKPQVNLPADANIDDLRQALKHKDPDLQEEAAKRLEKLGPKAVSALANLEDTLTNPEYPDKTRVLAALAIGHIGAKAKAAVPSLVKMLDSDERSGIRQAAVEALIELKYPTNASAHPTLLKIIEKDSNTNLRCLCVIALGPGNQVENFRKSGADKALTKLLDEKDSTTVWLRYNAAFCLACFLKHESPPKTADWLLELLKHKEGTAYKESVSVAVKAAEALAQLGDKAAKRPDVARALRQAAKDQDEKLGAAARKAMKELGIKE